MAQPTQLRNPRRLLILAPSSHSPSTIPPFLHALTGVPVTAATFAGYTTHPPLHIQNKYYTADVPIWVDEIPFDTDPPSSSTHPSSSPAPSTTNPPDKDLPAVTPTQWQAEFSSPEAQVVRDAIGALLICVRNIDFPSTPLAPAEAGGEGEGPHPAPEAVDVHARADVRALKDFLRAVGAVRALIEDERGGVDEVPAVVVLVGRADAAPPTTAPTTREDDGLGGDVDEDRPFSVPWWEDQLFEMGMVGVEVVGWDPRGGEGETRNRFGEYQGMRRVREVLETHQWAAAESEAVDDDDDVDELERQLLGLDDEAGFDWEVGELEREMAGLRFAMEREAAEVEGEDEGEGPGGGDGDERRVESVETLLLRMQAIREMSDELPEQERKRFAARAVRDIMKEL